MKLARLAAPVIVLALVGCGGSSDETSTDSGSDPTPDTAKFEQEIQSREESALPTDAKFVGDPTINVSCKNQACSATLSTAVAQNLPFAEDEWTISGDAVKLDGGSGIVGFMAADARYGCTIRFADSGGDPASLKPCALVAHAKLP